MFRIKAFAIAAVLLVIPSRGLAQASLDSLMNLAATYRHQEEYLKSNDCYEQLIDAIKDFDDGGLTGKIMGLMSLNYIYLGIPLLKEGDYEKAGPFFRKAVEYAKHDPKIALSANSWMGQWYSMQSLDMRARGTDLWRAVEYSLSAERYFELAHAPEKRLNQQIARASTLSGLSRMTEAEQLLQMTIRECEERSGLEGQLAKALSELGKLEKNAENYQSAIFHLERSYEIGISGDRQTARLAAVYLHELFENMVPDKEKAALWKMRIEELNDSPSI